MASRPRKATSSGGSLKAVGSSTKRPSRRALRAPSAGKAVPVATGAQLNNDLSSKIKDLKEQLDKLQARVDILEPFVYGRRDRFTPGLLGALGIEPDNPGSFLDKAPGGQILIARVADLVIGQRIARAMAEGLDEDPFSDEFKIQLVEAVEQRIDDFEHTDDTEEAEQ